MLNNLMTMDEYALHRGVSKGAISQACSAKRIIPVESFQGKKKSLFFDTLVCDADWIKNSRPKKTDLPPPPIVAAKRAGRPTNAQLEAKAYLSATLPKTAPTSMPRGVKQPFFDFGDSKPSRKASQDLTEEQKEAIELARRRARADTEKSEADSLKARLAAEQAAQLLVDAEDMEDAFSALAADVRDRMLNLAPSLKSIYPELGTEVIESLIKLITDALADLSKVPERKPTRVSSRIRDTQGIK